MRRAVVEGKFYPGKKEELKNQIGGFFSSLEISSLAKKKFKAAIIPHAGYSYSGRCAAHVYKHIQDNEFDSFIIIGTNHSGLGGKVNFSVDDYETILGTIECDMEIIEDILVRCKKNRIEVGVSEEVHRYEHSIEVQLPFLQFLQKKFKIVPVIFGELSYLESKDIAKMMSDVIKEHEKNGKRIFVIASSDFTHYGKDYGFVPFSENVRENLYGLDEKYINLITSLDSEEFYTESKKTTICGRIPISVMIEIARNLKLNGEKLCYYSSGDISGKWDNSVGYASIGFY